MVYRPFASSLLAMGKDGYERIERERVAGAESLSPITGMGEELAVSIP